METVTFAILSSNDFGEVGQSETGVLAACSITSNIAWKVNFTAPFTKSKEAASLVIVLLHVHLKCPLHKAIHFSERKKSNEN